MQLSRVILCTVFATLFSAFSPLVLAQQSPTGNGDAEQVVSVQSTRDPDLRPYRTMLKGLDAYADHGKLAPDAPLRFILFPAVPSMKLDDTTLYLSADNFSIPVPLATDGSFELKRDKSAFDANADLVSNKKRDSLRWRPDIHTPGLPGNVRRLGDLRLECEVRWAVEQEQLSFVKRNLFRMAGGPCHSAMIHVMFLSPRPLAAVHARSGERTLQLRVTDEQRRYVAPLHDSSWDDNTLLTLSYVNDAAAISAGMH